MFRFSYFIQTTIYVQVCEYQLDFWFLGVVALLIAQKFQEKCCMVVANGGIPAPAPELDFPQPALQRKMGDPVKHMLQKHSPARQLAQVKTNSAQLLLGNPLPIQCCQSARFKCRRLISLVFSAIVLKSRRESSPSILSEFAWGASFISSSFCCSATTLGEQLVILGSAQFTPVGQDCGDTQEEEEFLFLEKPQYFRGDMQREKQTHQRQRLLIYIHTSSSYV